MTVSRLRDIPGIGVDRMGDRADAASDPDILRLENLDTDLAPPKVALEVTRQAIVDDGANSYLPFQGRLSLRDAASRHVGRAAGRAYDPFTECVSVAGGLNGILNTFLATVEPGQEVVLTDPVYAGIVNRIRLAGGVPRFVPSRPTPAGWTVDPEQFAAAVGPSTAAVFLMGPNMPAGDVFDSALLDALAGPVGRQGCWIVYDAAMERIRFDDRPVLHPARHPALAERTITVGSASKELRMIGWRVGWVVGSAPILADINLVGLSNVVCQVGISQEAVASALTAADAEQDIRLARRTWQGRAETVLDQLADYPCVPPHGGWSLLVDCRPLGVTPEVASDMLFRRGRVAATPMSGWGPQAGDYLRLVYANEPVERLAQLGSRFDATFGR